MPLGHPLPMYAHRSKRAAFDGDYETFDFHVYSYMYERYSDTLTLGHEQEVWRSPPGLDGTIPARIVVFDLAGPASAEQCCLH